MLSLPTHWVFLVRKDGTRENVMNADFSTKAEFRKDVKKLIEKYSKNIDTSVYEKAQYLLFNQETVIYECTIAECMEEN